jgi:O-Antigen ligase
MALTDESPGSLGRELTAVHPDGRRGEVGLVRSPRPRVRTVPRSSAGVLSAPNVVTGVLAASITLVRIASTFSHKTVTIPIVAVIFLACTLWCLPRQSRNVLFTGAAGLVFLYGADVGLALIRGAQDGAYVNMTSAAGKIVLYLTTIMLGMVAVTSAQDKAQRNQRLLAILLAPVIYVTINLFLAVGGVQNPVPAGPTAGTQAQLLSFIGIAGARQEYPLSTSINLYSIVASSSLAGLIVLRLRAPELLPRIVAWPLILICLYTVISGDSRTTLAVALVVVLVFVIWRRFAGAPWIAGVVPFFPLIVIGGLELLSSSGVAALLSRSGGGQTNFDSFSTGTGRVYVWRGAWEVIKHFSLQDVIGWGAAGQIPSLASTHYAFVFPTEPLAYTVFTHNVVLQTILDEGYLGLLILVVLLWRTFVLLRRHLRLDPRSPAAALVAMLLVIILSGATEVSPSYYSEEVLLMVFLIGGAAAALALKPGTSSEPASSP